MPQNPKLVTTLVRLEPSDLAWLQDTAAGLGPKVSQSDLVRDALKLYRAAFDGEVKTQVCERRTRRAERES